MVVFRAQAEVIRAILISGTSSILSSDAGLELMSGESPSHVSVMLAMTVSRMDNRWKLSFYDDPSVQRCLVPFESGVFSMSESVGSGNSVRVRTIVGLVVGATATAAAGILVAVDGGHILAARMLGAVGMVAALLGAVGSIRSSGTGVKAMFAIVSVLLFVASSTVYGLTWS